jgi:hypothetical protein
MVYIWYMVCIPCALFSPAGKYEGGLLSKHVVQLYKKLHQINYMIFTYTSFVLNIITTKLNPIVRRVCKMNKKSIPHENFCTHAG